MKKQIKWTAVLSTAAFMTALAPSFQAPVMAQPTGWTEDNGIWMFYDEDGYSVTDTWKKQDGNWYYLDEDGQLSFNRQIDEYYVGSDGKRVENQWVKIANDEDWGDDDAPEFYWYYYGKEGKALTSRFRTLDDKTYYFDGNGRMVTGLVTIDDDTYYFGKADDGVMKKGWVQLTHDDFGEEPSWHYFNSNGKMVLNEIDKRISGNYYTFKDGVMQTGWYKLPEDTTHQETDKTSGDDAAAAGTNGANDAVSEGTADAASDSSAVSGGNDVSGGNSSADGNDSADGNNTSDGSSDSTSSVTNQSKAPAAGYQYYDSDGKRASGWRTIDGIPEVSQEDEQYSFYFKNGKPYYAETGVQIFAVNANKYAFNTKGEMQKGFQTITLEDGSTANFYFGTDGVMKTGKQTIFNEDEGVHQTWLFHTEGEKRGQGYHGIRDNVIYENGLRRQADDTLRYAPVLFEGKSYLVNTAGTIQKASASSTSAAHPELGSGYRDFKDLTELVWTVDVNGIIQ